MKLEDELKRLAPGLLRYCRGRLGDPALAEEISQEALTALVTRWRRHGPPGSPAAFAFTVARRRAARLAWRRRLLSPFDASRDDGPAARAPDELFEEREHYRRTVAALERLPARDREVLLLVAAAELSTREAVDLLRISSSAVKMRLHRARKKLAELLEGST